MAKLTIQWKDPDGIGDFINEMCRPVKDRLLAAGLTEDEAWDAEVYLAEQEKWDDFFEWGEYGRIEVEIDENGKVTGGRLIPLSE